MTATNNVAASIQHQLDMLRNRWSRLSRPWQMVFLLGLLLAVALAVLRPERPRSTERVELLQGRQFTSDELTRLSLALADRDLTRFEVRDGRVYIPRDQFGAYLGALREADALPPDRDAIRKALQGGSFLDTESEREARWIAAKEQMLEHVLRQMDGIDEAFVIIGRADPRQRGLSGAPRATMTVAVRATDNQPLAARHAYAICQAVSGAVDHLTASDVTVTDLVTSNVYRGGDERWRDDAEFAALKSKYERQWSEKVRRVLKFIPHVEVLSEVMLTRVPAVPSSTNGSTLENDDGNSSGTPVSPPDTSGTWVPERVSVTVSVPRQYLVDTWRMRQRGVGNPDADKQPTTEELALIERETQQNVEQAVAGVSPMGGSVRLVPESRVIWFDTPTYSGAPEPTDAAPAAVAQWLASGELLVGFLVVLTIVGICLVWGVARDIWRLCRGQAPVAAQGAEVRVVVHDHVTPSRGVATIPMSDPVSADVTTDAGCHPGLTELVREDPQAAVSMLKSWLSKAG